MYWLFSAGIIFVLVIYCWMINEDNKSLREQIDQLRVSLKATRSHYKKKVKSE